MFYFTLFVFANNLDPSWYTEYKRGCQELAEGFVTFFISCSLNSSQEFLLSFSPSSHCSFFGGSWLKSLYLGPTCPKETQWSVAEGKFKICSSCAAVLLFHSLKVILPEASEKISIICVFNALSNETYLF